MFARTLSQHFSFFASHCRNCMEPAAIKSWKGRKVLPDRRSRRDQKIYRRQALTCWPTQYRLMWDLWHVGSKCASSCCLYLQQMKTLLRTSGVWAENWAAVVTSSFLLCDGQGLCLQCETCWCRQEVGQCDRRMHLGIRQISYLRGDWENELTLRLRFRSEK